MKTISTQFGGLCLFASVVLRIESKSAINEIPAGIILLVAFVSLGIEWRCLRRGRSRCLSARAAQFHQQRIQGLPRRPSSEFRRRPVLGRWSNPQDDPDGTDHLNSLLNSSIHEGATDEWRLFYLSASRRIIQRMSFVQYERTRYLPPRPTTTWRY